MAMIASFTGGVYYFGETALARALEHHVRDAIEAGAEFGFRHLGKLHRSRGAQAPEFCCRDPRLKKARETACQEARASPFARGLCGPRGASRRAVRRFCGARAALSDVPLRPASGSRAPPPFWVGLALRASGRPGGPPSASSSRGVVVPPGREPRRRPSARPAKPRPRAPARTPRAGATGSRPLGGSGEGEYKPILQGEDKLSRKCDYSPKVQLWTAINTAGGEPSCSVRCELFE
jgi:hypothetical protein